MPERKPAAAMEVSSELKLSRQISQAVAASADGIINIPPATAQEILDLLNFEHQRRLKPANVLGLQCKILSGMWNPVHPICFARIGEQLIGVNLQHRMHAVVAADTAVRMRVLIVDCANEHAVATLYGEFDPKGSVRSEIDSIAAHDLSSGFGLTLTIVQRAVAALKVVMNGMEPISGITTNDNVSISMVETRMGEFPRWIEQVRAWDQVVRRAPTHVRAKLLSGTVMAVGLYTLKYQPELADLFWTGLADNDQLPKDDPRARLLGDFQSRKRAHPRIRVLAAAHAWNAWCEGRKLASIRVDQAAPILIAGTPLARPRKHN
jgi:hypothetical protein